MILVLLGAGSCADKVAEIKQTENYSAVESTLATGKILECEFINLDAACFDTLVNVIPAKVKKEHLSSEKLFPVKIIPPIGEPVKISFGKGSIPNLKKIQLGEPKKLNIMPQLTSVKPFHKEVLSKVSFNEIGLNQGMKSSFISSIFKDSRGYFWFGSRRGITKYDGFNFTYYQLAKDAEHRLVGGICEDAEGNIWMSFSAHGGLVKFDGRSFYEYHEGSGLDLGEAYLGILGSDSNENIWLKGHSTIVRMKDGDLTIFPYHFQDLVNLNIILKDGVTDEVWLSGMGGVCSIEGDEMTYHAVEEFDQKNLCHPVIVTSEDVLISTGKGVTKMTSDSLIVYHSGFVTTNNIRNCLAIGSDFILSSENKNNAFCYVHGDQIEVFWEAIPVFSGARPFYVDENKNVWLSQFGKGVIIYNPYGLTHFKFETLKDGGPVSALIEDKKGNVWFGGHGFGLVMYDGSFYHTINLVNENIQCTVRSLCESRDGKIWVGTTEHGCFTVTPDTKEDNSFYISHLNLAKNSSYSVYTIRESENGDIWLGTLENGLLKVSKTMEVFETVYMDQEVSKEIEQIRSILENKAGEIVIGTQAGGLFILQNEKEQFIHYTKEEGLSSNHIVTLFEDSKQKLWIGFQDAGVNVISGESIWTLNTSNAVSSDAVWSIIEDTNGHIWLGADNMLNIILRGSEFTDEDKITVKSLRNLAGMEGGEFYANAVFLDSNENLWWGTDQFATKIENTGFYSEVEIPSLHLEEVKLVNNHVDFIDLKETTKNNETKLIGVDESYDLSKIEFDDVVPFTNCPKNLKLPAAFNDLTFEYAVTDPGEADEIVFSFLLSGLDAKWTEPSGSNKISYHALPAGEYTLKARVSSVKGIWSEPVSYQFTVYPVWYKTKTAQLIWIFIISGIVFLVFWFFRRRRREKLEADEIKQLIRLKSELYSNVTHEFRTPLTLIMGMTDKIKGNEQERQAILRNSKKLLRHINELLDIAKNESGLQTLSMIQADIVEVLKINVEYFDTLAVEKDIDLTFYSEVDHLVMDFDEEKIQHIIYNLLSNAIKFTPDHGKIIFHVSSGKIGEQPALIFKVKDTGAGIAEENLLHIFDRFYQVGGRSADKGTGIGLSLVTGFVELMKGDIQVKSKLGEGTVFEIRLPIENTAVRLDDAPVKQHVAEEELQELSVEKREEFQEEILVIEDNDDIAQFIAGLLGSRYKLHMAKNGAEGVQMALEKVPDAIISDVAMPEMNGYEVCEVLKTDDITNHIPIILLTAKVAHEDKMKGLTYGADAYITKPFRQEELLLRLQKLIESRKLLRTKFSSNVTEATTQGQSAEITFLNKLKDCIDDELENAEYGVPQLAASIGMSQMQLYRKLKAIVGNTPSHFIRKYRLERAKELLMNPELTISEVAYQVGFSDPNYFSRVFHKEFGGPPNQFRN